MAYQAYQPSSQPYHDPPDREVSPIEGHDAQFPPAPPVHRNLPVGAHPNGAFNPQPYGANNYSDYSPPPGVTPGSDNLGAASAGGGFNGIAAGVANTNQRESGAEAVRDMNSWGRNGDSNVAGPRGVPLGMDPAGTPFADTYSYDQPVQPRPIHTQHSNGSNSASVMASSNSSELSIPLTSRPAHLNPYPYADNPYNRFSSSNLNQAPQMGEINPNDVADDDDWGMGPETSTQQKRRSFVPFSPSRDGSSDGSLKAAAAAGTAAAGAGAGAAAFAATRDTSGEYNAVPGGSPPEPMREKHNDWREREHGHRKRTTWIVSTIIALIVLGAILGGVLGSQFGKRGGKKANTEAEHADALASDNKNDLDLQSDEIKKLMGNKDLHKVFPGMDYTPLNAQYPDCIHIPPSQNNITRDMAVMSQLTNAVRLYGTDCNQTEMVLHSIDRLELKDMKVWLGVWLGKNDTTNTRQVDQMWDIIDHHGADRFKGIIVGNEVLYREDLTETELLKYISDIKSNLTDHKIDLPIATSDLGDNWNGDMATKVDVVMSNVHPFFAGVDVEAASGWTWSFWTTHDVALTASDKDIKQVVAEVGWPSAGGNSCGASECTSATQGSIAGVDEMNKFMESWICPSLKNGTEFFWFSAFDEPWKITYNTKGKEWEDKWGLMDVNRNLKPGVTIPECQGESLPS
ncbi:glycoside hydrolase superfamily [Massariosphaeria phaeospora]|uniref:glucan endo-1,3-beta-D-glucosidase n=1 Tax=Massariosphaeria phaeospora TaxID=100035 RepID=A0A7C8I0F7_9PLEO|nr:glycoside hydrolase superfamily [Massariosphaeria phaeospora]